MKLLACAIAALAAAASLAELPPGFTDDFAKAKERAGKEDRLILADFTGTGWCVWCKRLDDEVFRDPSFASAATNDFVLLTVDTPKGVRTDMVKKYSIFAFPTVLVMDADGGVLAQTGYKPGGAKKYLEHLKDTVLPEAKRRKAEGKAAPDVKNMPWL